MDIVFASSKDKNLYNTQKDLVKVFGLENAKRIRKRLDELRDATTLADIAALPQARCHELKGNRKGQLALDIKQPRRLIIEPANDPVPLKVDGGLDWTNVTAVKVIEVVDYHD